MVYWVNKRSSCNIQTQVTLGKCDYTWNKEHQLPVNKYTERCYRCSAGVMIRHTLPETHDNKHTLQQRHRENRWATKEQWRVTWEQLWWCCPRAGSSQQPRPRSAAPVSSPGSSRWRPEPPCLPPCPGSCLKHRGQRSDSLRADVCVCVRVLPRPKVLLLSWWAALSWDTSSALSYPALSAMMVGSCNTNTLKLSAWCSYSAITGPKMRPVQNYWTLTSHRIHSKPVLGSNALLSFHYFTYLTRYTFQNSNYSFKLRSRCFTSLRTEVLLTNPLIITHEL